MKTDILRVVRACLLATMGSLLLFGELAAGQPDPFAGNNTLYPDCSASNSASCLGWNGSFRTSNYDYPPKPAAVQWTTVRPNFKLTKVTAPAYVAAVKRFIQKDISGLVNDPMNWSPQNAGWYDMPWGGQGSPMSNGKVDPTSGREALLGSYTGQVLQPNSYPSMPPKAAFQNHAVVYYNDVAAAQLGKIWGNPFKPDIAAAQFPEGSIVVKVEAVTLDPDQWPILANSSVSYIYRPSVASLSNPDPTQRAAVVTPMRFLQMAVRVKDKLASPDTGWVFMAFAYDTHANGATVWDRTIPVGAMWGNDPKLAIYPDGLGPNGQLQETWVNAGLPSFIMDGLGWGGRLAGPLDVGIRHNAVTVSGKRYDNKKSLAASACVSCHSSAQYPFVANLYPSPNMVFPDEGKPFLFFDPGTPLWARWYQNNPGTRALAGNGRNGIVGTDYDLMLTFALMRANGSADTDAFIRQPLAGH